MSGVDQIFQQWNKKAKYELAKSGVAWQKVERIPFSSPRLQYLTYGGAAAFGALVEFSGPEGAGKTCAALDVVPPALDARIPAAVLDAALQLPAVARKAPSEKRTKGYSSASAYLSGIAPYSVE